MRGVHEARVTLKGGTRENVTFFCAHLLPSGDTYMNLTSPIYSIEKKACSRRPVSKRRDSSEGTKKPERLESSRVKNIIRLKRSPAFSLRRRYRTVCISPRFIN